MDSVSTEYAAPTGRRLLVRPTDNLQRILDSASPGDVVVLPAGATFIGNFSLPKKEGSRWIVITSDAPLPPAGTRITPAQSTRLPKLVSANSNPVISTERGAAYYRIMGVEVGVQATVSSMTAIVSLGLSQQTMSEVPRHIVLDRVYIHGHPTLNLRRCVAMNSAYTAVIDSYLSDCHSKGTDSQAIATWNGPGPFKIQNNYLEGAGENVMFGGADPSIHGLIPSDIEIRGNTFTKPLSWRGVWTVKNLFESKNAQRLLLEGNVLENNWADAQDGFAVVLKSTDQGGGNNCSWCVTQHVTFRNNVVRNSASGIKISALEKESGRPANRFLIESNLLVVGGEGLGGATAGKAIQLSSGVDHVQIIHNTILAPHTVVSLYPSVVPTAKSTARGFVYRDNLAEHGSYGINGGGMGRQALDTFYPDAYELRQNGFFGGTRYQPARYPESTWYVSTMTEVRFVDATSGDYRLRSSSPFHKKASDGTDLGMTLGPR